MYFGSGVLNYMIISDTWICSVMIGLYVRKIIFYLMSSLQNHDLIRHVQENSSRSQQEQMSGGGIKCRIS